jgi:hypothetical protein
MSPRRPGAASARRLPAPALRALCCVTLAACGSGAEPSDPPDEIQLAVKVEVDTTDFRSTGEFALNLVPFDHTGRTYLMEDWEISVELAAPASTSAARLSEGVEPADTQSVATAILIDDSGSMRFADPDRFRATAAQIFAHEIILGRPGNLVALFDFGRGEVEPSPGFDRTNLLVPFTSSEAVLSAGLDQIQAIPGGATPLYHSAAEVVSWMDTTTPPEFLRALLIITDGAPSDPAIADSLFALSVSHGVRIFTVGVGAAAHSDPPSPEALRLQEIAVRTGGIYAAAEPPEELHPVVLILAESANPARLLVRLRLDPLPAAGVDIGGTVSLQGIRGNAAAEWSFTAP